MSGEALRPQLQMRRAHLLGLPPIGPPAGYALRTHRPGDEAAWADIMNTGIGTGWTASRCSELLTGLPQFKPERLFFAVSTIDAAAVPIGSACAWTLRPGDTNLGYLHMVCVRPEHRGHRLGYWLSLAVLVCFRDTGFQAAVLNTDDFRLPAIREYLQLGFEPDLIHPSHPERWQRVLEALQPPGG